MPRPKSYSSKISSIKDILGRALNALNELAQDFSELIAEAEKYKEIKPLLDKLAPVHKDGPPDQGPPDQGPPDQGQPSIITDKKKSGKKKKKGKNNVQTTEPNLEP